MSYDHEGVDYLSLLVFVRDFKKLRRKMVKLLKFQNDCKRQKFHRIKPASFSIIENGKNIYRSLFVLKIVKMLKF